MRALRWRSIAIVWPAIGLGQQPRRPGVRAEGDRAVPTARRRLLALLAPPALVLAAALWTLGGTAGTAAVHGDEAAYYGGTRYFDLLFVQRDVSNPAWGDPDPGTPDPAIHSQPMLTRYIVGAWVRARAALLGRPDSGIRRIEELQQKAGLSRHAEGTAPQTVEVGRRMPARLWEEKAGQPSPAAQVAEARAPMVLLGSVAIVLLYGLGRLLAGALAGLAAAALALSSVLIRESLARAMSEAPLMLLVLLALLLAIVGVRRTRGGAVSVRWGVVVGVVLGLAMQTKLTAALSLVAVGAWAVLVVGLAAGRARGGTLARAVAGLRAGSGWALALVVAFGVFVVTNPHLYPDPLTHTGHLFTSRAETTDVFMDRFYRDALTSGADRVGYVLGGSLVHFTGSGSLGVPLEALLAPLGGLVLLVGSWRSWRRTGVPGPEGLALLTVLVYFAATCALSGLAWPRYLVPTVLLGALLSGIGFAAICRWLAGVAARVRAPATLGASMRAGEEQA